MDISELSYLISAVVSLVAVAMAVLIMARGFRARIRAGGLTVDFERAAAEIREHLPSVDAPHEDRQYALLREYHSRGLAQSTQSFWFSLAAASLGFLVILSAVAVIAFQQTTGSDGSGTALLPGLQLASGLVIEAVSALFFVQSNKARALMAEFFDKLREDRKLDESLTLVEKMNDGPTKDRVQAVLALAFSGSVNEKTTAIVLQDPLAAG